MSKSFRGTVSIQIYEDTGLLRGQVGTVVEVYEPGVFEVEFSDNQGKTYALEALPADKLLLLHHQAPSNETLITAK